jgi:hypothetical protein
MLSNTILDAAANDNMFTHLPTLRWYWGIGGMAIQDEDEDEDGALANLSSPAIQTSSRRHKQTSTVGGYKDAGTATVRSERTAHAIQYHRHAISTTARRSTSECNCQPQHMLGEGMEH